MDHLEALVNLQGMRTREELVTWLIEECAHAEFGLPHFRLHFRLPQWYPDCLRRLGPEIDRVTQGLYAERVYARRTEAMESHNATLAAHVAATERRLQAENYHEQLNRRLRQMEPRIGLLERQIESDIAHIDQRQELERREVEAQRQRKEWHEIQAAISFVKAAENGDIPAITSFLKRSNKVLDRPFQDSNVYDYVMANASEKIRQLLQEARNMGEQGAPPYGAQGAPPVSADVR